MKSRINKFSFGIIRISDRFSCNRFKFRKGMIRGEINLIFVFH